MKKRGLFLLLAIIMMGCKAENSDVTDDNKSEAVRIRIFVDNQSTKGVEEGHPGSGKVIPKINTVTVYAYNDYGNLISQLDLTKEQQKAALHGEDSGLPGTVPGATIGLPVGTKRMDVVLNNPSDKYTTISTNINYYNYRPGEEPQVNGKSDFPTGTIFDRTFLTTDEYGVGRDVESMSKNGDVYEGEFVVKPMLARFEVYNSINVEDKKLYKDINKQTWKKINATDFLNYLKTENPDVTDISDVLRPGGELSNKYGIVGPDPEKESESVTINYYYIPAYYWFVTADGNDIAEEFNEGNTYKDSETDVTISQWIKSPYYSKLTAIEPLQWYPNFYHAVDVEEIFVNNLKVRNATLNPYLHPWPNADKAKGWPHWYKAYHPYGWHTAGSSADNSFLCMGNMWDRIADSDKKLIIDWAGSGLAVPDVSGGDQLEMDVITGKAKPIANKSAYGDAANNRNLGVFTDKAASYHFYPQSVASSNKEVIANSLPHIILKVKCYETPADYAAGKAAEQKDFITIKLFTNTASGTDYIKKFERSNIYRINLVDIVSLFKSPVPVPGTFPEDRPTYVPDNPVDADPEMPGSQVNVKIQVIPWSIQNIFPGVH